MSEEERLLKKYSLKEQIVAIPIKAIVAFLIARYGGCPFNLSNIPYPFDGIICFIVVYSICSVIAYLSTAAGNWLIGIVLFIGITFGISALDLSDTVQNIIGVIICIGGFTLDVFRLVQYIRLSRKKKEHAANPEVGNMMQP